MYKALPKMALNVKKNATTCLYKGDEIHIVCEIVGRRSLKRKNYLKREKKGENKRAEKYEPNMVNESKAPRGPDVFLPLSRSASPRNNY
jgi:hypothetical protein